MKIDTEGVYTLQYTAEDECGNVTVEERTVSVENITYRTVLYTDGTFIINEKSSDIDANAALHGAATNIYDPLGVNDYVFSRDRDRPWHSQASSVKSVRIGSSIAPTSMKYWLSGFSGCTDMNFRNLDTSQVVAMASAFSGCRAISSLDLSGFDTSNVTDLTYMFTNCVALTSLDLSSFNTAKVTNMRDLFYSCSSLTSLDLSSFDTALVDNMQEMFRNCGALQTIYASTKFVTDNVTNSFYMFVSATNIRGGAGTTWNSNNPSDKTYARIDGGTSNPGYFTAKAA